MHRFKYDSGCLKPQPDGFKADNAEKAIISFVEEIRHQQFHKGREINPWMHAYEQNLYDNRIFDALARFLYIQDGQKPTLTCCAVSVGIYDGTQKLVVAYNRNSQNVQDSVRNMWDKILYSVWTRDANYLVKYCLEQKHYFYCEESKFCSDTASYLKDTIFEIIKEYKSSNGLEFNAPEIAQKIKKPVGEFFVELYAKTPQNIIDLKQTIDLARYKATTLLRGCSEAANVDITTSTFQRIKDLVIGNVERKLYFWERLIHDSEKMVKNFQDHLVLAKIMGNGGEHIYFVPNARGAHCELIILADQKEHGIYNYVGLSKPSCFTCDVQFTIEEAMRDSIILHCGGSGIAYPVISVPNVFLLRNSDLTARLCLEAYKSYDDDKTTLLDPGLQYSDRPFSPTGERIVSATIGEEKPYICDIMGCEDEDFNWW